MQACNSCTCFLNAGSSVSGAADVLIHGCCILKALLEIKVFSNFHNSQTMYFKHPCIETLEVHAKLDVLNIVSLLIVLLMPV